MNQQLEKPLKTALILFSICFKIFAQTPTLLPPTITGVTQISSSTLKFDVTPSASPITSINGYDLIVTEDGQGFRTGGTSLESNTFILNSVIPGRNYCLSLRTYGYSQNYSAYSSAFCGSTTNTLREPTLTTTQNFTSSVVKVNFTPNPANIFESANSGYHRLYYKKVGENYDENRTIPNFAPYNYFAFTTAQAGVEYCFKAKAAEWSATSDQFSNEICAITVNTIRTPTITSVEKLPGSKLKINWSTTYVNPLIYSKFEIFMKTDNGAFANYWPANNIFNDVYFANTHSLAAGHSYTFKVRIIDDGGNVGGWSNEVTEIISNDLQPPIINTVEQLETGKVQINVTASITPTTDFTNYEIWYSKNAGSTWEKTYFSPTGTALENVIISSLYTLNNYCFKIRTINGSSFSAFSNEKCIALNNLLTPPTITNFTQELGTTALKIEYNPSTLPPSQVDNYKLYLTKNGLTQNLNIISYISYNPIYLYSLEAGNRYCVMLKTNKHPNESPASNELCIDIENRLTPPQITNISQTSSSKLKIFWSNPNLSSNTGNLKYKFYKSEDRGLNYTQLGTSAQLNENNIEITNLTAGKNYCFKIKTTDETNYSAFSNNMCLDLTNTLPTPTLTNINTISTGKIKVDFSLPAENLEPFQYYYLYYSIDGAPFNVNAYFPFQKTADNFLIVNNLLPGKNYCFKLATNDFPNFSANSNQLCIVPINTLATPTITSISPVSSSKMRVNFAPPNQSADVLYYKLYYKASTATSYQVTNINQFLTNYTITGLVANVEYCFKLKAFKSEEVFSLESELVCGQTVNNLLPPTPTSIMQNNSSSFLVNIQASANPQSDFEYYLISKSENGGDFIGFTTIDKTLSQTNIFNLTSEKDYCFKFATVDGPNLSAFSNQICQTLQNTLRPPTISVVEQLSTDRVRVVIIPPTNPSNNIQSYKLYHTVDGGALQFDGYLNNNNETLVTNLFVGKNMCFKVQTSDGINNSVFSNEICIVPVNMLLPPTISSIEPISSNSLKINFILPQNFNNNNYFEIHKKQADGSFSFFNGFFPSGNTSYIITEVVANISNCFKLKTQEGQYKSDFSNEACGQTVNDLVTPTLNSVTQTDTRSQRISWTKNNTSSRTDLRYEILFSIDGVNYNYLGPTSATVSDYTSVIANQNYCYKIRETDGVNYSSFSNEICLINANNLQPPTPIIIEKINSHTVKLKWQKPNSTFYEYKIYRNKTDGSFENIAFSYQSETILYDIKAGENFCLKLKTYDGINYSDFSVPICTTITNTLLPPTISSVNQTLSSRQEITWAHSTTFANEFTSYRIYKTIDGGQLKLIGTVNNYTNNLTDYRAIDGKNNCYKIVSFDGYNESPYSTEYCTVPVNDLLAPTISNITKNSTRSIKFDISNQMPNSQQFSYSIYVSTNGGAFTLFGKIENEYNYTYRFPSAKVGDNYCFKVILGDFTSIANTNLNETNLSGFSNEICYQINDNLPKPTIIEITQANYQNQISFSYDYNIGYIGYANIYRNENGGAFAKINNGLIFTNYYRSTTYDDFTSQANITYCYRIELTDGLNFSEFSDAVCFPNNNCFSLKSGEWDDPSVWSCNKIPTSSDDITIKNNHIITVKANYTAQAKSIINNGNLELNANSTIILE